MKKLITSFMLGIVLMLSLVTIVSAEVHKETFEETDQRTYTQTLTIPNLYKVNSVSTTNGNVTYTVKGDTLTLTFKNGVHHDERIPEKFIEYSSAPQRSKVFSDTYRYSQDGWTGDLRKKGEVYQETDGTDYWYCDVKIGPQMTAPPAESSCSANGHKVTAYQKDVIVADSDTVKEVKTKKVTSGPYLVDIDSCPTSEGCTTKTSPSFVYYNDDGWWGQLYEKNYKYIVTGYLNNGLGGFSYSRTNEGYEGTASKTFYYPLYTGIYEGSYSQNYTRWGHKYEGTVYRPLTKFYIYDVSVDYSINHLPEISSDSTYPLTINATDVGPYLFKFKIRDLDGDAVTARLTIGSTGSATYNVPAGTKSFPSTFWETSRASFSDGNYKLTLNLNDGKQSNVIDLGTLKVDRTAPNITVSSSAKAWNSASISEGSHIIYKLYPTEKLSVAPTLKVNGKEVKTYPTVGNTYVGFLPIDKSYNGTVELNHTVSGYKDWVGNPGQTVTGSKNYTFNTNPASSYSVSLVDTPSMIRKSGENINVRVSPSRPNERVNWLFLKMFGEEVSNTSKSGYDTVGTDRYYHYTSTTSVTADHLKDYPGKVDFAGVIIDESGNIIEFSDTTDGTFTYLRQYSNDDSYEAADGRDTNKQIVRDTDMHNPDGEPARMKKVSVWTDNPNDSKVARPGDMVYLEFSYDKPLYDKPLVEIDGSVHTVILKNTSFLVKWKNSAIETRDFEFLIKSTKDATGVMTEDISKTTDKSSVRLLGAELATAKLVKLYSDFKYGDLMKPTYNNKVFAEIEFSDIEAVPNLEKTEVSLAKTTKNSAVAQSYEPMVYSSHKGNVVTYIAHVAPEWGLNYYTVDGLYFSDNYNRLLEDVTVYKDNVFEITQYGTPVWEDVSVYSIGGEGVYLEGSPLFIRATLDFPGIFGETLSTASINGISAPLYDVTDDSLIFKVDGFELTNEPLRIIIYSSRDMYDRIIPGKVFNVPYTVKTQGSYKVVSLVSSNYINPKQATVGDIVELVLDPVSQFENPPASVIIDGQTIQGTHTDEGSFYQYKVTSESTIGRLSVTIPASGGLPKMTDDDLVSNVDVFREHSGWELITLNSSKDILEKGDTVTLSARIEGKFLSKPKVTIGTIDYYPVVNGDSFSINHKLDEATPYGKLNFSITEVNTTNGATSAYETTDGSSKTYTGNSDIITRFAAYTSTSNRSSSQTSSLKAYIEVDGEIVEPGYIKMHSSTDAPEMTSPFTLLDDGVLEAEFMSGYTTRDKYHYFSIYGVKVKRNGKIHTVEYDGTPFASNYTYTESTNRKALPNNDSRITYFVNDKESSVAKPGDRITIRMRGLTQIYSFPEKLLIDEVKGNQVTYEKTSTGYDINFIATSNMVGDWTKVDMRGLHYEDSEGEGYVPYIRGDIPVWIIPANTQREKLAEIDYVDLVLEQGQMVSSDVPLTSRADKGYIYLYVKTKPGITITKGATFQIASEFGKTYLGLSASTKIEDHADGSATYRARASLGTFNSIVTDSDGLAKFRIYANLSSGLEFSNGKTYSRGTLVGDPLLPLHYADGVTSSLSTLTNGYSTYSTTYSLGTLSYDSLSIESVGKDGNVLNVTTKSSPGNSVTFTYPINSTLDQIGSYVSTDYMYLKNAQGKKLRIKFPKNFRNTTAVPVLDTAEMNINIRSNNEASEKIAYEGDQIYLTLKSNTPIKTLGETRIIDVSTDNSRGRAETSKSIYGVFGAQFTKLVESWASSTTNHVKFRTNVSSGVDFNSSANKQYGATTDGSYVTIAKREEFFTGITISGNGADPKYVMSGDEVTLRFKVGDTVVPKSTPVDVIIGKKTIQHTLVTGWNEIKVPANSTNFEPGLVTFLIEGFRSTSGDISRGTFNSTTDGSSLVYLDEVSIKLDSLSITSNNANKSVAYTGDTITATLTYSKTPSRTPKVKIAGTNATVTGSGTTYTAKIVVSDMESRGIASIEVDANPNKTFNGYVKGTTTNGSYVSIEYTKEPVKTNTITMYSSNPYDKTKAEVGDKVTLEVFVSKPLADSPGIKLGTQFVPVEVSGRILKYSFVVTNNTPLGTVTFETVVAGKDADGFEYSPGNRTTDGSVVTIVDKVPIPDGTTPPTTDPGPTPTPTPIVDLKIQSATIYSNNAQRDKATTGNTISVEIRYNETPTQGTLSIAGKTSTVTGIGDKAYKYTVTVDSTVTDGLVVINAVGLGSKGSNALITGVVPTTDSSKVTVDKTPPKYLNYTTNSKITDTSSSAEAKLIFDEDLKQIPTITGLGVAKASLNATNKNELDLVFQINKETYPKDGIVLKLTKVTDLLGNSGTIDNIRIVFDTNITEPTPSPTPTATPKPTITPVVMESLTMSSNKTGQFVTDGDTVYLDFKASGAIGTVSSVMVGNKSYTPVVSGNGFRVTVPINSSVAEGPIGFYITDVTDKSGRGIANGLSSLTSGEALIVKRSLDVNLVVSSHSTTNSTAGGGKVDDIIKLVIRPSKPLTSFELEVSNGNVLYPDISSDGSTFTFEYLVKSTDPDGSVTFKPINLRSASATDITYTFVSPQYIIDNSPPKASSVTASGNQTLIIFNEALRGTPTFSVDGVEVSGTISSSSRALINRILSSISSIETVSVLDRYGNMNSGERVYEVTPPSSGNIMINIYGVSNNGSYDSFVIPTYSASSRLSDEVTVTATLNGVPFVSGSSITSSGSYTLKVTAVDGLGNTGTLTYTFVVQ